MSDVSPRAGSAGTRSVGTDRERAQTHASGVWASSTQAAGRSPAKAPMAGTFSAGANDTGGNRTTRQGRQVQRS